MILEWTYYRLETGRHVVGWMRKTATLTQYLDLMGDRWRTKEIPHASEILLEEIPPAFAYDRWGQL